MTRGVRINKLHVFYAMCSSPMGKEVATLRKKFRILREVLDEHWRHVWAVAEADALPGGGASLVAAGYGGQAVDRTGLPRTEGRRLAGLGTHASLDRLQDSHPRLLLHAPHLFAPLPSQKGPGSVGRSIHRTITRELEQIKQFVLLYPTQGEKGPARTAYVLSQQTLTQQGPRQSSQFGTAAP
jgi:hypothetical protein